MRTLCYWFYNKQRQEVWNGRFWYSSCSLRLVDMWAAHTAPVRSQSPRICRSYGAAGSDGRLWRVPSERRTCSWGEERGGEATRMTSWTTYWLYRQHEDMTAHVLSEETNGQLTCLWGWGTSTRCLGLLQSFPSCWLIAGPHPGPNPSSHPPRPVHRKWDKFVWSLYFSLFWLFLVPSPSCDLVTWTTDKSEHLTSQ